MNRHIGVWINNNMCLLRFEYDLCSPRVRVLKFNPLYKILRGWKINPTMMFRSGTFGRWLGLENVIRVEFSPSFSLSLWLSFTVCALSHPSTLAVGRPSPDAAFQPRLPQTGARIKYLSVTWLQIFHYSNSKQINTMS
jgi:hypothetical protein